MMFRKHGWLCRCKLVFLKYLCSMQCLDFYANRLWRNILFCCPKLTCAHWITGEFWIISAIKSELHFFFNNWPPPHIYFKVDLLQTNTTCHLDYVVISSFHTFQSKHNERCDATHLCDPEASLSRVGMGVVLCCERARWKWGDGRWVELEKWRKAQLWIHCSPH